MASTSPAIRRSSPALLGMFCSFALSSGSFALTSIIASRRFASFRKRETRESAWPMVRVTFAGGGGGGLTVMHYLYSKLTAVVKRLLALAAILLSLAFCLLTLARVCRVLVRLRVVKAT